MNRFMSDKEINKKTTLFSVSQWRWSGLSGGRRLAGALGIAATHCLVGPPHCTVQ